MSSKNALAVGDIWYNPRTNLYRLITSIEVIEHKTLNNLISYVDIDIQDVNFGTIGLIENTTEKTCNPHTFARFAIHRIEVDQIYVNFAEMLRLYKEAEKK